MSLKRVVKRVLTDRFILFEDKREVELVWNGKTREVSTAILPFQMLEHIDEPRKEATEQEATLFDMRGRQLKGWTNKLIWGDNKLILSPLKSGLLRRQIDDSLRAEARLLFGNDTMTLVPVNGF